MKSHWRTLLLLDTQHSHLAKRMTCLIVFKYHLLSWFECSLRSSVSSLVFQNRKMMSTGWPKPALMLTCHLDSEF